MTTIPEKKNAIVLVMFGTSVEHALPGLLHVRDRMATRFPQTPVQVAFSSKIIRRIWRERAGDPYYRAAHPEVPEDILTVQGPEAVIANLRESGAGSLIVQPVHIAPAEKDVGPGPLIEGLNIVETGTSVPASPCKIVFGRPALGTIGRAYPYSEDIVAVARSLAPDAALARQEKAALFYMGHGNRSWSTGKVYQELVLEIRRQYPDILTVMSLVEGPSSVNSIVEELKAENADRIVLKPFMIVAGNHVRKDMVGNDPGTLKTQLEKEGFTVFPVMTGLGESTAFVDVFVQHAADAARDVGIELT